MSDTAAILTAAGTFLTVVLGGMGSFLVVWSRNQRRAQAAADTRLQRQHEASLAQVNLVLQLAENRAQADRASHEKISEALVDTLRDHMKNDDEHFTAIRNKLSDVHDAVKTSPCRANGH